MRFLLAVICFMGVAGPAAAQRHAHCSSADASALEAALAQAKALTLRAAVSVGPSETYEKWFGPYTRRNSEDVRATLKSVLRAIQTGAVTTRCETLSNDTCATGGYAFVFPTMPYVVHICPRFFELPAFTTLNAGRASNEYGTRGGTFIHELSHFRVAADTEDHCYGRATCSELAQDVPRLAVKNADSYQYFAEDIGFLAKTDAAGKPPTAGRLPAE